MQMCKRLWEENGLFSLNEDKVRAYLHRYFKKDKVIVGVVGETEIEASTCLVMSDYYYTDDWHLAELWNFVDAPFRQSRNAEALIEFGKECAVKMGMPFFTGIITDSRMAGKVRLYRRLLGYPTGAFFVYNAKWTPQPFEEDNTDLWKELKKFGHLCNNNKVTSSMARKEIAPLLRRAAEAVATDSLWGSKKSNGHGEAGSDL